jgi:hypothetical protein
MIKKLLGVACFSVLVGFAAKPAPAIDFVCSCSLCTTSTSGLACRDFDHLPRLTSCGEYHVKYCS